MKVLIREPSWKGLLPWVQRVLFAGGSLMLAYCGFALLDTWLFQRWEIQNLEHLARTEPASPELLPAIARGGLIGRVEIPRLGVSVVFVKERRIPRFGGRPGISQGRRSRDKSAILVSLEDLAVLNPGGSEILTLVTCYPFYFVGPAPNRFVVRAEGVT